TRRYRWRVREHRPLARSAIRCGRRAAISEGTGRREFGYRKGLRFVSARNALNAAFALALAALPLGVRAAGETAVPAPAVQTVDGSTIVQQTDARLSLVGIEVVVRAGLDRQTLKQNGLAALVAATILHTPVARSAGETPVSLDQVVAANGGSVRVTVDPGDVRFYIESLASDSPAVVDLFRRALAAPDFSPATLRAARGALMTQIAASQQYALQVGIDMLNAASSPQANAGMPSLGTPASL